MKEKFVSLWQWVYQNPLSFFMGLGISVVSIIALAVIIKVIIWVVRR